jgi:integrase
MHKGWIERRGEEMVLCVRQRAEEGFTLKTGGVRERDIELAPWIADEVASADSYMVPGNTPYMRSKWMMRDFCGWCAPFIPDRKGRAYELRKQAGSDWLTKTGSWAETQYLLGHASPTTTAKWYASYGKVPKSSTVWATA